MERVSLHRCKMTVTVGDGNSEGCACRERFASITKLRSARTLEASEDSAPRLGLI